MIRLFLVDDHEVVRRGIRDLLHTTDEMVVVGEASSGAEALRLVPQVAADVVVMDVRLGDADGITVWTRLHEQCPALRCLMLSAYADDEAVLAAIRTGAQGYVLKSARCGELIDAVRAIAAGRSLFTADFEARVHARVDHPDDEDPRTACLSRQEHRVLALLVEGLTNRQMAAAMGLTEKTVKNYVSNLLLKLGMQCRTEAAVYAAHGLHRCTTDGRRPVGESWPGLTGSCPSARGARATEPNGSGGVAVGGAH